MAESSPARQAAGSIYDLGYRGYEGPRLGRSYAFTSLFWYSFVSVWGIGRSFWAKFFPFALGGIMMLPAFAILAFAALAPADFEIVQPQEYFELISIVPILFCAISAPELIGRDQRQRTLSLYFSRALSRIDYVAAKVGALSLSLFLVLVFPQVLVQLGNAVADESLTGYLGDNLDLYPPIIFSSLVVAIFMSTLSLALAIQTSRRAFSTVAVIAAFIVLAVIATVFTETLDGDAGRYAILLSPIDTLAGMTYWAFGAAVPDDSALERADLEGIIYLLAVVVVSGVATAVILRRILRMNV